MEREGQQRETVERLAEEFVERYRRGERPALSEYARRYPEHASEIKELFPALVMLERVAPGSDESLAPLPPRGVGTPGCLERLGDYRLLREVGRGGMGVVYEAQQLSLGRHVALKVLPARLLGDRMRQRFEREARAAARLHHSNIVPVFGVGEYDGQPYYVMQFIQGQGLDAVLEELQLLRASGKKSGSASRPTSGEGRVSSRDVSAADLGRSLLTGEFLAGAVADLTDDQTPVMAAGQALPAPTFDSGCLSDSMALSSVVLPGAARQPGRKPATYWQSAARIGLQVANALEYAHHQGIQHRDIKPSNLLLDNQGTVWVTDFGLAKADDQHNLTHTGDVLGTLRYMPPEAFEGKADARSDVYSLGLTLYELLAFRPAFDEKERTKLIRQVMSAEPTRLRKVNAQVPRDLETVVHKAIDPDPARRYQTAGELAADLQRFLDDEPIRARRQSALETVWRWARHHRTVASLVAAVFLLLVAITVGSVVAAAHFRDQEKGQRGLVQEKAALAERNQRLAEENETAKKKAEEAQKRAEITLVDTQTARGLLAAERGDPARAVLWFTRAAEGGADMRRQADNHRRARNWARHLTVPVRAFPMGESVRALEFRPGGDLLLMQRDDRLFVRDWRRDRFLSWANAIPKIGAAFWSPAGEWLAIGYHSGVVQIRGVPDGRVLQEVKHKGAVTALAFSPNGQYLAIAGTEVRDWRGSRTVLPWDVARGQVPPLVGETVVRVLSVSSRTLLPGDWKHPQPVHSLVFNRAGNRLITACMDKRARVFAVAGDSCRPVPLFDPLPHEPRRPTPPALVEGDRRLITVSAYGLDRGNPTQLTVWDAETGKPAGAGAVRARPSYPPRVVASPHGDWFTTAGHYGPEVWETADPGTRSVYLDDHTEYVEDLVPSPDGKALLSVSWDRTARLWSVPDGKPLGSPLPHMGNVTRCAIASDNIHLATLAEGLVRIWKRFDGGVADIYPTKCRGILRPSFDGCLITPGINHEHPYGFSPIGGGELLVLSVSTGKTAGPAVALPGQLVDSCVCADNRTVAAVSEEKGTGWLSLNDVFTGRALAEPRRLPGPPRSVAARPSSPQVAVLCAGGELLVFDHRRGERLLDLNHGGEVASWRVSRVEYTPDGSALVSLTQGKEHRIHVRDAGTGRLRCPPIRPVLQGGPCRSFALSADSRLLATAVNGKNAAQVWDLASGRALCEPLPHPGKNYGLFCLCFSRDGRYLLTGCADGQACLWDWQAGTLACAPLKHDDQVLAVALTPDGRFALTAGRDRASKLHVWELMTGRLVAPKIQLPTNVTSISCPLAGGRVVVSSFGSVARLDLAKLLSPPEMPIEDYRLLGELASGQRIEQGDESGLTQDEWLRRLKVFNQKYPAYGRPDPVEAVTLHRKAAQTLLDASRPLAGIAH